MTKKVQRLHGVEDFFDYLKHLTTLATGSLVLLATFSEKIAPAGRLTILFSFGVLGFLASIVFSIICMLFVLSSRRYDEDEPEWENNTIIITFLGCILSLLCGVGATALYAVLKIAVQ